jgi:hypothetical protein
VKIIRSGAGAGYSGDRIEPAIELAERGGVQYLVFECLAERTVALAHQERRRQPSRGYDPFLAQRMHAVLRPCMAKGIRIITNSGAANPLGGAEQVAEVARSLGISGVRIAAVTGDDVLSLLQNGDFPIHETGGRFAELGGRVVSANAYIGASALVEALAGGADVVVTGRAADPSLYLAPLVHEFGWAMDDWHRMGQGTLVGHLLECAGQITGGYFADPGFKEVPALARLGFPIGEVDRDGSVVISKLSGSGGRVSEATCKEQLLYEIHDPARYLTPDVAADFSEVTVREIGSDRVRVEGGTGTERPETLKVSVGYIDGYVGEGQISYGGPGAIARARLALDVVAERLEMTGLRAVERRLDLIGYDALYGPAPSIDGREPPEVRARVAVRTQTLEDAIRVGNEVESLYTNGPAGGGGVTKSARDVVGVVSTFLPRQLVRPSVHYLEV